MASLPKLQKNIKSIVDLDDFPALTSFLVPTKNDNKCWDGKNKKILSEEIINKSQPQEQIKKKVPKLVQKNKIIKYDDDNYDDNENIDDYFDY